MSILQWLLGLNSSRSLWNIKLGESCKQLKIINPFEEEKNEEK